MEIQLWCDVLTGGFGAHPDHDICHDLAKWLSYYLYFISFHFFSFLLLGLTTQKGVWESVTSQVLHSHSHMTGSHMMGYMISVGK